MNNKIIRGEKTFTKGDKIINFPLRLTKKLHKRITNTAHDENVSKHKFIIDAIDYYIMINSQ